MKKFLFLSLILSAVISTTAHAQSGPQAQGGTDPAMMLQQIKEKVKPQMIEKTGLTEALADKVIEINFETRMAASSLSNLDEAERTKKIAELKAAKEKKLSEILTPEQKTAVTTFYQEMGKNMAPKNGH